MSTIQGFLVSLILTVAHTNSQGSILAEIVPSPSAQMHLQKQKLLNDCHNSEIISLPKIVYWVEYLLWRPLGRHDYKQRTTQPRCDIPSLPFRELSWSGSGFRVSSLRLRISLLGGHGLKLSL